MGRRLMATVAILGCGPTGLLAAYAVQEAGHHSIIISERTKSHIPGSQHLHGPVPGLTPVYPEGTIQFVRLGSAEGYAQKVYGDSSKATGWDNYFQVYPSWNMIKMYDKLWSMFEFRVIDRKIDPEVMWTICNEYHHDMIITTIPIWATCERPQDHAFNGVDYAIRELPMPEGETNEVVVYNGLPDDEWYRWSILGGKCSIEYPSHHLPEATKENEGGWTFGKKAVGNTCKCWPGVHRVGRWAEWSHGVTVYSSYQKVTELLRELT